jgi:predicted AlkP superfamily phosphohydrolase/phosphomutase
MGVGMGRNMSGRRIVIIGLDGMPYRLMERFAYDGTMPNFGTLVDEGVFREMASSIPEVSSVAWSSVITGTNPGEHGVFGFTDIAPGTYRTTFPNYNSLEVRPFWECGAGSRSVIINVPTTFPVREMNGVHIAGFVALDLERATYPSALVPKLQEIDYRVDVDSQKAHEALGFFLRDLDKTLQSRIDLYRYLWHEENWDTFMLVFTGTDRLAHFLWHAYEDESHKYREAFVNHFRQIDEVIGEIADSLTRDDTLIMLSDHGFERLKNDVYVNHVLQKQGFLTFEDGAPASLKAIAGESKAFALDPGRLYVHLSSRYPNGSVEARNRQAVTGDLEALFGSLELEGMKVISKVFRAEELYSGSEMYRAPDLVLLGNNGYNLRGNWKANRSFGKDIFTGKHSQADAFLLLWGEGTEGIVPEKPDVTNIVGILDRVGIRSVG